MSQLALQNPAEFSLLIIKGVDKGTVYNLVASNITIGRGTECDIVINDARISRKHALLSINAGAVSLTNVSGKNKIHVDGKEVDSCVLNPNSKITLGETTLRFTTAQNLPQPSSPPSALSPAGSNHSPARHEGQEPFAAGAADLGQASKPSKSRNNKPAGKKNFYIIIGIIVAFFAYLLMDDPGKKKGQELNLKTDEQVSKEIKDAENRLSEIYKKKQLEGKTSREYTLAQPYFVKGMRDFKQGQFERAMESFQACLSIHSRHTLCARYQNLASKRFSELIQYHIIQGRRYMEKGQFKPCKSAFYNVMIMVKDRTNPKYKEAKANYQYCEAMTKDRY